MRIAALLFAMTLAGCAAEPPAVGRATAAFVPVPPPVAEAAPGPPIVAAPALALRAPVASGCRMEPVAVLALLPSRGAKPVVMIRVDGRALRMAVDTGAETSVLSPQTAAVLGLAAGPGRTGVEGLGGAAGYGSVQVDRIDLGDGAVRGRVLPVMRLGEEAEPPAGLIGADLLRPYQAVFDFPAGRLTLYRARACTQVSPGGPGAWSSLRWRVAAHDLPLVGASLDGHPLIALLDTGTAYSAVAAGRAGGELNGRRDPVVTGYAAGGLALHGSLHRFERLGVGAIGVARPMMRVVPMGGLPIDLLIGMDVLRSTRLWLDYPGRRAFLQDATPGS